MSSLNNFPFFLKFCCHEFPFLHRHSNLWESLLRELRGEYSPPTLINALKTLQERRHTIPNRFDNLARYYKGILRSNAEEQALVNKERAQVGSNNTMFIGGKVEPK